MSPHVVAVVTATVIAAKKRADPGRRAVARRHHVGFFAWLRRWTRFRRNRDET